MQRNEVTTYTNTYNKVVSMCCDICGKENPNGPDFTYDKNWAEPSSGAYRKETTVAYEEIDRYEGHTYKTEWDVCLECFNKHIKVLFKNEGRTTEY